MALLTHVPGPIALKEGQQPFYSIAGKGYHLETLQELPYGDWATLSCVGVILPLDYQPTSQPILIATTYGGVVIEGQLKIIAQSSQRTLESAIIGLYKMVLPIMDGSTLTGAKVLPGPDEETVRLLQALKKHRFSLNQYLGRSSVPMKRNLITYDGIAVPEAWVPCFKNPIDYDRANIILIGRDESGNERAAVASYNVTTGKLAPPRPMK